MSTDGSQRVLSLDSRRRANRLTRQLVVRVDDQLYASLEADAEANGRTIAQSVRFLLRATNEINR